MAQPVFVLSVDLQTKTATFTSGLADAAKGARTSFNDIRDGAKEMGADTAYSMTEARHSVMLLGEEFGIHLPRALTSFIASLGPIGAAMEAAFFFLAIIVGATLLLEHLSKLKENGEKLTESQTNFGTTVSNVLNGLNTKLLEAGIKTDELNHNHLAALDKQLELIDRQSMAELVQSFGVVAKAADLTFAQLKTSWYQWGAGAAGAKNALETFKTEYDSLLAQGKDKEANDLLAGTRKSAEHVLDLQKQIKAAANAKGTEGDFGDTVKLEALSNELKKAGAGYTLKEVESQQILVDALQAQASVQEKVNELKTAQKDNAVQATQNHMGGDSDKAAREQAQQQRQALEEANKLWEENYRRAVAALQQSEKEKIDATKQGSAARLAAIDSAIKEEESKGLQETGFYRSLLTSRVQLVREMTQEEKKLKAEADNEAAGTFMRMGLLQVAADKEAGQLRMSAKRVTDQERMAEDLKIAGEEYAIQQTASSMKIAALDNTDKDFENKLKAIQNKQLEMTREHENQITQIKDRAEEDRNRRVLAAENRFNDDISKGLAQVAMRHESFAHMMTGLGAQVAAGLLQNAAMAILADDMTKPHDAAAAARKAYLAGMQFPFPANLVMGPALGAGAFATVMAFEEGGIVPGVGKGDIVPARLEPGEGVISKRNMERMANQSSQGSNGPAVHIHHSPTYHVNTIDGDGIKQVLDKHGDQFAEHATNHIRKMNH